MTQNAEAAEDLAQDVFIKAYDALPTFRQDASFSTWLYQITVRKCLDWKRSTARYRQRVNELVSEQQMKFGDTATPEVVFLDKEGTSSLMALVDDLREPYRTVTKMFYMEECSCQEIAKSTGASVKTVESQLYRARRMLRE